MQDWSPNSWDIDQWREQFPSIDVVENLEALAAWTQKNEGNKAKRRKVKTAQKWISGRLRAKFEESEGYSKQSRARDDLAKPTWERLGHKSEEAFDQIQHETYLKSLQNGLEIDPDKYTPAAKEAVRACRELLDAMPTVPKVEDTRPDMLHCEHEFKEQTYSIGRICRCGMFEEQFLSPLLEKVVWR